MNAAQPSSASGGIRRLLGPRRRRRRRVPARAADPPLLALSLGGGGWCGSVRLQQPRGIEGMPSYRRWRWARNVDGNHHQVHWRLSRVAGGEGSGWWPPRRCGGFARGAERVADRRERGSGGGGRFVWLWSSHVSGSDG
jgi:hypothetical protein